MSRSNGPAKQPGAWPPQRPGTQSGSYEQELAAWNAAQNAQNAHNPGQQAHWPAQAQAPGPQGAHGGSQAYAPPQHNGYAAQPPGYHYPAAAEHHDPYAGHAAHGPEGGYAQSYAPQFDPYMPPAPQAHVPQTHVPQTHAPQAHVPQAPAPQAPAAAHHGYGAAHVYGQMSQPQYAPPHAPQPALSQELSSLQRGPSAVSDASAYPAPELRGSHYDQWAQPAYQAAPLAAPDPHGYDLGGYAQPVESASYRQQPSLEPAHSEWGGADGPYDAYAQQPYAGDAQARGGQLEPTYQHEEGADYEIEEPKRGRSWGLIAAALVGAIAVGAGMTYGYRMVTGPGSSSATPVIKNSGAPSKVKPAEPGGKQFAHTDSKIMGRLNDQTGGASMAAAPTPSAAPVSTPSDADPSGARKVQTMVIGRDGAIVPSAPAPEAPPRVAAASAQPIAVPGMTIVDGFGGRPPSASLADSASPAAAVPPAPPVAARPVVVSPPPIAAPPPAAAAPARPTVVARAAPQPAEADAASLAPAAAPKVAVPKKPPAQAVAAAPAAAAAPTGGNGYVAVLASVPASQKSSLDALKQFADMQQKYSSALANKTPEVREANLGDKGIYHRLLVGPPGSREQAGQLCTQLKASGYGSCWVTAY